MPDSKITALTAITTVNPATFPLVIVDTSDTSMAITGTTKKVTTNQLLGSGGTATLASATITGDLTVKTNVLKVDTTNNRVGIGTASPTVSLDMTVAGAAGDVNAFRLFRNTDTLNDSISILFSTNGRTSAVRHIQPGGGIGTLCFDVQGSEQYRIGSGTFTWYDGAGGTRMTLNATGLGVGGSPTTGVKLHVGGGNAHIRNAAGGQTKLIFGPSANYVEMGGIIYDDTDGTLTFGVIQNYAAKFITNNTERLRIKPTGQVRFVPLAADPAGAEAGDVYYNSTSNKLKCYNGTTWNDLF